MVWAQIRRAAEILSRAVRFLRVFGRVGSSSRPLTGAKRFQLLRLLCGYADP